MHSSSMQSVAVKMDTPSECIASLNGSGEINRHENFSSSNEFSYSLQGVLKDAGEKVPHTASAVILRKHTDPEANRTAMRNGSSKSDLEKTIPKRHFYVLDFFQESRGKVNVHVNSNHICRYCKRQFRSGRALGGHMRTHGPQVVDQRTTRLDIQPVDGEQLSGSVGNMMLTHSDQSFQNHASSLPSADSHMISSARLRFKHYNESKSELQSRGAFQTESFEDLAMRDEEDTLSVRGSSSSEANNDREPSPDEEFPNDKFPGVDDKVHPLYALRRNPKRSQRFTDQEFAFDAAPAIQISAPALKQPSFPSPERSRACFECGKEFMSWKALFGHMRCHPDREWRGIQPPDSVGQQDRVGSSSGIAGRKRRLAVYRSFDQDSGLELESGLSKDGEDAEASYKTPDVDATTIRRDKEFREAEASNKRGEDEVSNTRGEQQEEVNTTMENNIEGEEEASKRNEWKLSDNERSDIESIRGGSTDTWSQRSFHRCVTGKRSKRTRHTVRPLRIATSHEPVVDAVTTPTEIKEERDMAYCLVMLAYGGRSLEGVGKTHRQLSEESAFSDSGRHWMTQQGAQRSEDDSEEEEMSWISKTRMSLQRSAADKEVDDVSPCEDGDTRGQVNTVRQRRVGDNVMKYECSTCKRIFNSHQALGGHRASHRRVKGCFAKTSTGEEVHESVDDIIDEEYLKLEDELLKEPQIVPSKEGERPDASKWKDGQQMIVATTVRNSKCHECSICHRVFASGQALGGHKRCHWTGEKITETASVASSKQASTIHGLKRIVKDDFLDLNLPAPLDDDDMEVPYGMAEVIPAYNRFLDVNRAEESIRVHELTALKRENGCISEDGQSREEMHLEDSVLVDVDRRLEDNAEAYENCDYGRSSSQVKLNFSSRFIRCNVCDNLFTSLEAFSNHQKTHASLVASITGLTPISA